MLPWKTTTYNYHKHHKHNYLTTARNHRPKHNLSGSHSRPGSCDGSGRHQVLPADGISRAGVPPLELDSAQGMALLVCVACINCQRARHYGHVCVPVPVRVCMCVRVCVRGFFEGIRQHLDARAYYRRACAHPGPETEQPPRHRRWHSQDC